MDIFGLHDIYTRRFRSWYEITFYIPLLKECITARSISSVCTNSPNTRDVFYTNFLVLSWSGVMQMGIWGALSAPARGGLEHLGGGGVEGASSSVQIRKRRFLRGRGLCSQRGNNMMDVCWAWCLGVSMDDLFLGSDFREEANSLYRFNRADKTDFWRCNSWIVALIFAIWSSFALAACLRS